MTLIHRFDFEVTTQRSLGFLIVDYWAEKPLKLPISSGEKKYLSTRLSVFLCM